MKWVSTLLVWFCCVVLLAADTVSADDTSDCPTLAPNTLFLDLDGNAVDPAKVDSIALKETGSGTVLVYRRTSADAEALVNALIRSSRIDHSC